MTYSRFNKIFGALLATGGSLMVAPSMAQTSYSASGELQVEITLVPACLINGSLASDDDEDIDFGTLNFGERTTFFTTATGTASGGSGGNFTISCTPTYSPSLTFDGGENSAQATGSGTRAMNFGSQYVSYSLLNNSTPIPINQPIPVSSGTFNINGIAYGGTGLNAGIYTDIVTITLTL